jgi:UDP-glucose 4-epimerase
MKIAVTGGTGFIGRHVVAALAAAGHELTVIARTPVPLDGATVVQGDVADRAIGGAIGSVDIIIHLAGLADPSLSMRDPVGYTLVNAVGTLNVLEAARQVGAGVIFASSQRVYEPWQGPLREDGPLVPNTVYGWSKLAAEGWVTMYRQTYDLPTITLRLFSVYGPGQRISGGVSGVVAIFAERALRGQELVVMQRSLRDFVYVADVAAAFVRAVERLRDPALTTRTYNIGAGIGTGFAELAATIRERGMLEKEPPVIDRSRSDERREEAFASIERARQELGWTPTVALPEGINRYLTWLRAELAREEAG